MKRKFSLAALAAVVMLSLALPAQAGTVMLDQVGLLSGRQSFVIPITISGPGQLSVSLKDLGWAGSLADLSFSLSRTGTLLSANPATAALSTGLGAQSSGLTSYSVSEAGTYYASISGRASGPYNLGLYGVQVSFASAIAPQVPLPAAAWLLLSGLGGLMGLVRKRSAQSIGALAAA